MVRPFAAKGKKRKNREKYDRDDDGESTAPAKKSMVEEEPLNGTENEEFQELEGIPIVPSDPKSGNNNNPGVIFVLERASLEVAKVGKTYQLLNSDDHSNFLRRNNRNPGDYRPDICHQALLAIFDSRIAKAGRLKAVYVKTEKGLLIEIKPYVRLPRTQKRFYGVMLQLLQKLSITAAGKREKLFRVIKNPVTQYLPANSRKMGFSHSSDKLINVRNYLDAVKDDVDLVFVVGAMAHGKIEIDYTDDLLAISEYPLSASCCIADICKDCAEKWNFKYYKGLISSVFEGLEFRFRHQLHSYSKFDTQWLAHLLRRGRRERIWRNTTETTTTAENQPAPAKKSLNDAAEEEFQELEGIPIVPSDPKRGNNNNPGVIFVLERASLELAKVGKSYQLLNSKHSKILRRNNRNPADYRPDILHHALMMIFDSRIAKAGRLKGVYVKTDKGLLIEIKPYVRLPREQDRFYGLMLELLQKLSIRAAGEREKLLQVVKNPVIGFSHSSNKLVRMRNVLDAVKDDVDLVFVVGAMAHGKIEIDYTDDLLAISEYPLSAGYCAADICKDLADKWDIW